MELLRYKVAHQRLTGGKTKLVSGYIDYVEAEFDFTPDWTGLDKWAHFTKGDVTYDVNLIDDRIEKEQHLNLSEGTWEVKLHGDKNENGEVVMRITTDTAYISVESYGEIHEGGVLPESVATAAEQIAAKVEDAVTKAEDALSLANEVKAKADAGDFNGKDGYTPKIEIEQTYDAATDRSGFTLKVFNEDGSFSVAGVKDGERGPQGIQGVQGLRGPAGIDGITYYYELEETESGVNITVTDAGGRVYATAFIKNGEDGKEGPAGADGEPGENGFSPTVEIQPIWSAEGPLLGRRIIITDVNGPQVFSVLNGEDGKDYVLTEEDKKEIAGMIEGEGGGNGEPGADGFSPTVEVTEISGGHNVAITDVNGKKSFDVMDGKEGPQGPAGNDGAPGKDGTPGKSAYQYAVDGGFEGTEEDFANLLASGSGGAEEVYIGATAPTDNNIELWVDTSEEVDPEDGTAVNVAPPDWAQNDPAAADYVKNRTHWAETSQDWIKIAGAENLPFTNGAATLYGEDLINGETYKVVWNDTEFMCECFILNYMGIECLAIGNKAAAGGENTGEPFAIAYLSSGGNPYYMIMDLMGATSNTVGIYVFGAKTIYHPIDHNYMPDVYVLNATFTSGNILGDANERNTRELVEKLVNKNIKVVDNTGALLLQFSNINLNTGSYSCVFVKKKGDIVSFEHRPDSIDVESVVARDYIELTAANAAETNERYRFCIQRDGKPYVKTASTDTIIWRGD